MHDTQLIKKLSEIGLSEKESAVYLTMLSKDVVERITEISMESHLPRTTIYDILDSLHTKGLIEVIEEGKKKSFRAQPPHHIFGYIHRQQMEILSAKQRVEEIMPVLSLIGKPLSPVQYLKAFQGKEGIIAMWEEQIATLEENAQLSIMCTPVMFATFQTYFQEKSRELMDRNIAVRILIASQSDEPVYIKMTNLEVKSMRSRYVLASSIDIVPGSVGFFTDIPEMSAQVLANHLIAQSQLVIFDSLWEHIF